MWTCHAWIVNHSSQNKPASANTAFPPAAPVASLSVAVQQALRAAVELHRRDVKVALISQSAWGGTSACSGSDKQTLHTANTADHGDDYRNMAAAIGAGGAMDTDTAYVEAVGSGPRHGFTAISRPPIAARSARRHSAISDRP